MKISKELKVGLLTVAAIALFIFGYYFLKGRNLLETDRIFYVVYENVEGLAKSAPVTINGLQVGNIDDISFLDTRGRLIVKFHVDNSFDFSEDSKAQVYSTGLIGGKALAIIPNYDSDAGLAQSGDTLPGGQDKGISQEVMDEFLPLKDKVENLVVSADTVLQDLHSTLTPELRNSIVNSIKSLDATMREVQGVVGKANNVLERNEGSIDSMITNLNTTSRNFAAISDELTEVDIAAAVKKLEESIEQINSILASVENGEGSLGKLMKDDQLYINLENATKEAEELIRDLKLNPKRYVHFSVFGKKEKDYQPADDVEENEE